MQHKLCLRFSLFSFLQKFLLYYWTGLKYSGQFLIIFFVFVNGKVTRAKCKQQVETANHCERLEKIKSLIVISPKSDLLYTVFSFMNTHLKSFVVFQKSLTKKFITPSQIIRMHDESLVWYPTVTRTMNKNPNASWITSFFNPVASNIGSCIWTAS